MRWTRALPTGGGGPSGVRAAAATALVALVVSACTSNDGGHTRASGPGTRPAPQSAPGTYTMHGVRVERPLDALPELERSWRASVAPPRNVGSVDLAKPPTQWPVQPTNAPPDAHCYVAVDASGELMETVFCGPVNRSGATVWDSIRVTPDQSRPGGLSSQGAPSRGQGVPAMGSSALFDSQGRRGDPGRSVPPAPVPVAQPGRVYPLAVVPPPPAESRDGIPVRSAADAQFVWRDDVTEHRMYLWKPAPLAVNARGEFLAAPAGTNLVHFSLDMSRTFETVTLTTGSRSIPVRPVPGRTSTYAGSFVLEGGTAVLTFTRHDGPDHHLVTTKHDLRTGRVSGSS